MKISDLNIFVATAYYLSFTEAAYQLNMTQPGISRTIKNIEKQLGTELFDRSGNTLALTHAGQVFLHSSQSIIDQYQATVSQLDGHSQDTSGKVKLRCMNYMMNLLADKFLPAFMERYPSIQIEHRSLIFHEPTDHEYDAIRISIQKPNDQQMIAKRLLTYKDNYYASRSYLEKYGRPEHPAQLGKHRCLISNPFKQTPSYWTYGNNQQIIDIPHHNRFTTNSLQVAATLCIHGQGIAKLPGFLIKEYLADTDVVPVFQQDTTITGNIYAIYKRQKIQPFRVKLVLREIALFFAEFEKKHAQ